MLKNANYPIYKDLEQYKVYDFNIVNDIHHDIIVLIQHLYKRVEKTNNDIKIDKQKMVNGLNIANYIYNYIFSNTMLETNIQLFENYLSSYHSHHSSVLNNLKEKFLLMCNQLDDIHGETPKERIENENIKENILKVEPNENIKEKNLKVEVETIVKNDEIKPKVIPPKTVKRINF